VAEEHPPERTEPTERTAPTSLDPEQRGTAVESGAGPQARSASAGWGNRLLGGLIVTVALVVLVLIGAAFLPRWWAHRIGQVADGSFTAGIASGLACGIAFTALPLAALRGVVKRHRSWSARFAFLLLAGLLAAPNLLTLGIVLGTNRAAHAGQRTMDVDAPGFRGATAVGAVLGMVLIVALWSLIAGRHRRKREIVRLKDELRQRDQSPDSRPDTDDPPR
jgi:hypothetical protein